MARRYRSEALRFLHDRYVGDDPKRLALLEEEHANAEVANQIFALRVAAGLSQRELARRVGTTASVICRLEDADYAGHSLSMLRRIALALGRRIELRFEPLRAKRGRRVRSAAPIAVHRRGRSRSSSVRKAERVR